MGGSVRLVRREQMSAPAITALNVERIRADFPILSQTVNGKPLVYLDNAATAQKPRAVLDSLEKFWQETNANIHRGVHFLSQKATAEYDRSRETVRRYINATSTDEIVFTKGCTEAINLVSTCLTRRVDAPVDQPLRYSANRRSTG